MTVLGPGAHGVVIATPDPRSAAMDRLTLRSAGIPAALVEDLGLALVAEPEGDDPLAEAAAAWAVVTRRPAVSRQGDRLAVGRPDGSVEVSEPATFSSELLQGGPAPRRAAVFGGAWIEEGEPEYADAVELGTRAAGAGIHLVCGGYGGIMEAVSRGAAGAGGAAIGISIAAWVGRVTPNPWLTHVVSARDLLARFPLLLDADVWVAFAGGVGTLAEVALCWNLMQMSVEPRPLLLVGERWGTLVEAFRRELIVTESGHHDLIRVCDVDEAAEALTARSR
ncbi:MAG TPA: LOG family protein [Actinomycetota bacterium]